MWVWYHDAKILCCPSANLFNIGGELCRIADRGAARQGDALSCVAVEEVPTQEHALAVLMDIFHTEFFPTDICQTIGNGRIDNSPQVGILVAAASGVDSLRL